MLIEKETTIGSVSSATDCSGKWARLNAINWTLNAKSIFGFHIRTAYLSLTYFDRFFSRRPIDNEKEWAIQLLAVACLSLAAKMEERKVPALSQYSVDGYNPKGNVIKRLELLVLNTLKWEMGSITPFEFLHYFITKFFGDSKPPTDLFSRAIELISSILKEISLMDHRPSVIAAAAVLAASDDQLTRTTMEFKINVIPSWGSSEKDHMFSCYNLLVEIEMEKSKTPKSTKRKLTCNADSDKQSPPKIHRP